jgi:hypothetical protein
MNKTRPLIREYKKGSLQFLLICKAEDLNQNQRNADKKTKESCSKAEAYA